MPVSYSDDIRRSMIDDVAQGERCRQAARVFGTRAFSVKVEPVSRFENATTKDSRSVTLGPFLDTE